MRTLPRLSPPSPRRPPRLAVRPGEAGLVPKVVLKGHTEAIYSTAFNKDGTLAVTGSFDKSVRLWDAANGKHAPRVLRPGRAPEPGPERRVQPGRRPGRVRRVGQLRPRLGRAADDPRPRPRPRRPAVDGVAVSPDGKTVAGATAGRDRQAVGRRREAARRP